MFHMKRKNNMVSVNESIVNLYRKMQATGKTDTRRMNWIQTLAKKAVLWKLPRWGSNTNNTVPSQAAEAFKKWFANQWTWWPITWIGGTALGTMVWWITDAVNIPYQWIKNLYNLWVDYYNAWASDRNALNQEKIYLDAIVDKMNSDAEEYRQANKGIQWNWLWVDYSANLDNKFYWQWNQRTIDFID